MAGAMGSARIEARIAAARTEKFKAKEALVSALDLAAWRLAVGEYDEASGGPILKDFAVNGYSVSVNYSIENEKIDLNLATEEIWRDFFPAAGFKAGEADRLAAHIADWRDADDLVRPNGAEASDYSDAKGKAIGNRPFNGVEELKLVLGIDEDFFACTAPAVTILGTGAPPSAQMLARIAANAPTTLNAALAPLGTAVRDATPGRRIVIEATAAKKEGILAVQRLTSVFRISGDLNSPFERVFEFRPGLEEAGKCGALMKRPE